MHAAAHMLLLYSTAIGTPGKTLGTMFTPVKVDITSYEPEKVGGKQIFNLTACSSYCNNNNFYILG